ncbi:hypothetical protein WA026_002381 [Henosepilachna vigintioctopunctata]|uniref:Uncharacterized protein n=1 Tax=Henosepilachna vigintioctopunctata TaxID=420089 RepID=A0AAW1U078_9CUCU
MHWNLLSVIIVIIAATSCSSIYSDFNDELPLYLSDDILITKIGRISKRSLIKDLEIETTGRERITKRDAEKESSKTKSLGDEVKEKPDESNEEFENKEESSIVFLPSFRKRTRRAADNNDKNIHYPKKEETTEQNEELINTETQDEQESGIVFLPSFGRRTRRHIVRRDSQSENVDKDKSKEKHSEEHNSSSTPNENKQKNNSPAKIKDKGQSDESDSEEEQESGLVFLPSFGRRTRRSISKRSAQSESNNKNVDKKEKSDATDATKANSSTNLKTILKKNKRKNENEKADNISKKADLPNGNVKSQDSKPNQHSDISGKESEETEESGIVFLPSFGRRTRRSTSKRSAPSQSTDGNINDSTKIKENAEKTDGRSNKSDTSKKNREKQGKDSSNDENSNESGNDSEEKQESGLVFLPSFGRRTRRDISRDIEKVSDNGESKNKKVDESNELDEDEEESGIVFLPSFGRRTRRQLT